MKPLSLYLRLEKAALARRDASRAINALEKDFRELARQDAAKKHGIEHPESLDSLYKRRNEEWRKADTEYAAALSALAAAPECEPRLFVCELCNLPIHPNPAFSDPTVHDWTKDGTGCRGRLIPLYAEEGEPDG